MGRRRAARRGWVRVRIPASVRWLGAAALLVSLAFGQEPEEATFRSDVRLVNLLVTVKDAKGVPIGGLSPENFRVLDNGDSREIRVFERRTDRPLSIVLLVDASLSTGVLIDYERNSGKRFAANVFGDGSHPDDRMAVMKFSEGVDLLADFTRSERSIGRGLERLKPQTGTSLYDGVLLASEELERRPGRHVIVLITDGGDTTSYSTYMQALEAAQAADAVIYSLTVLPVKADAGRNIGGEHTLELFAQNTGGVAFVEVGEEALNRAFDEILENLRTQYLIGYYPPEHTDPKTRFRRVEVQVDVPNTKVLARSGYYVPEERRILTPNDTNRDVSITPKGQKGWRTVDGSAAPAPQEAPKP